MFSFLFRPKTCAICKQSARDLLVSDGKKSERFCRKHLIQKFSESFLTCTNKLIVFHPEQNRKYCGTMYPFYPVADLVSQFYFKKEDAGVINRYLGIIVGKCLRCQDQNASNAYFPKGVLKWDGSGPLIRDVNVKPEILCSKCTLQKIVSDLENNKNSFSDNGLLLPYGGEGVYVNTYL